MIKDAFRLINEYKDRYLLALSLLPCKYFDLGEICNETLGKLSDIKSWRVRILVLEAYLLYGKLNEFNELLKELLGELMNNLSNGNFKIGSFIIPYLLSISDEASHELLFTISKFIENGLDNGSLDYLDFLEFWEMFMRYALLLRVPITELFDEIRGVFDRCGGTEDFLSVMSYYFRYSNIISPPEREILEIRDKVLSDTNAGDALKNIEFIGSFILSYSRINEEEALKLFLEIWNRYFKPVDSFNLYKSVRRIRALAGVLYGLTTRNTEKEFIDKAFGVIELINEFTKYFSWKMRDWKTSGEVSIDDLEPFIEDFSDIASEELLGAKELSLSLIHI